MPAKIPKFPGFIAHSDQVFSRASEAAQTTEQKILPKHQNDPTTVLLYGWGDGIPKHVAKYADGFRQLYPYATQIVVLSPISKAMFSNLRQRTDYMLPVLKVLFNNDDIDSSRVLVHTMSNTGAVNYAATLNAYQEAHGHPMPHQLLVMDSTPGSTELSWGNVSRWSRAMALGTAAWFPWPFVITQAIWGAFLVFNSLYGWMIGRQSAGQWSVRAVNHALYETKAARRLYLYSKEDDLILWEDIERHVAETRPLGWEADAELFSGSGHVGHMRMHPGQYWGAIQKSWEKAVQ